MHKTTESALISKCTEQSGGWGDRASTPETSLFQCFHGVFTEFLKNKVKFCIKLPSSP
ncbi:hypothetical protein [Microcoleus sp. A006_D1]|uniref:hypothetical protein n=1 Tax=Microcoleus sp. A006_D1 TaxID=3055267 RepID=UPI002FCF095C